MIGELIFLIGGYNNNNVGNTEVFNTKKRTWKTLPPMPTARNGIAIAVTENCFIWTFGGSDTSGQIHAPIEMFDILKND